MKKEELFKGFREHMIDMRNRYSEEIANSIDYTTLYKSPYDVLKKDTDDNEDSCTVKAEGSYEVLNKDIVEALFSTTIPGRTVVINLGSYKDPKEYTDLQKSLYCYSYLFDVLNNFYDFYSWNRKHANNNLFLDRALYTPKIFFEFNNKIKFADVVSLALPDFSVNNQEHLRKVFNTVVGRAEFLNSILNIHKVDNAILSVDSGLIRCKLMMDVADIYKVFVDKISIPKIIFAIPDKDLESYEILKEYLGV